MFDRLGSILKSYINDNKDTYSDYRNYEAGRNPKEKKSKWNVSSGSTAETNQKTTEKSKKLGFIPAELYQDFIRLGVPVTSDFPTCKAAHKKLLLKYHPDRHANNPFTLQRTTIMSAEINCSFQRIQTWFNTGKID